MKTNIEVVRLALDYIDENLQERLTFQAVAERFYYSPYFFDRIFQRIAGKTITEHIRERRLLSAAVLLNGVQPVTDICYSCGFDSHQSFSRAFRRMFGLSPSAYRTAGNKPDIPESGQIIQAYLSKLKGEQHTMVPRIIHLDEMIIAGLSFDGSRTGEAWERFEALEKSCPLADRVSQDAYEVRIYPEDRCDIFVGIQVEHATTQCKYETYVLPEGSYASFEILLANGWEYSNRLMDDWLKNNGRYRQRREESSGAYYAIEVYGDRFLGMDNLDSVIDMWVPVEQITV